MLLVASAAATNTPHDPVVAWLHQLGPSWTLSERTFAHGVSPSPGKMARPGLTIAQQSVGRWVKRIGPGWGG